MQARRPSVKPCIYSTPAAQDRRHNSAWMLVTCITALITTLVPTVHATPELSTTGAKQVSIGDGLSAPEIGKRNSTPVIPHNGNFVVFASLATNLTLGTHSSTTSPTFNVYLRHNDSSQTELVSARPDNTAPNRVNSGATNLLTGCIDPAVSDVASDGSFAIAFASDAKDLLADGYEPPGLSELGPAQVYLRIYRPEAPAQTFLISAAFNSVKRGADDRSDQPTVARVQSADGSISHRYTVCFRSKAGNFLGSGGLNLPKSKIYCLKGIGIKGGNGDFDPGVRQPEIAPPLGLESDDSAGHGSPTLSRNGSLLAFVSDLTVLASAPNSFNPPLKQVYSRSFTNNTTSLLSFAADGMPADGDSDNPSVSYDGGYVAFTHKPDTNPELSKELKGFAGKTSRFLVRHTVGTAGYLQINTTSTGAPSNNDVEAGRIDDSGRYAVFSDRGGNMDNQATGVAAQVYFKDLEPSLNSPGGPLLTVSVITTANGRLLGDWSSGTDGYGSRATHVTLASAKDNGIRFFTTAFTSLATNFGSIGSPLSTAPFIFRSQVYGSFGDPPPEDPTSTPTPAATSTPTPQTSPTPPASPPEAPIVSEPQLLVPNAPITEPPRIEVQPTNGGKRFDITIFCQLFTLDPSLGSKAKFLALAAAGARLTYAVEIRKAGSRQRVTRSSSKNVVTVRKLEPGRYTVRYRVSAKVGKKTIKTRTSPPATIVLS